MFIRGELALDITELLVKMKRRFLFADNIGLDTMELLTSADTEKRGYLPMELFASLLKDYLSIPMTQFEERLLVESFEGPEKQSIAYTSLYRQIRMALIPPDEEGDVAETIQLNTDLMRKLNWRTPHAAAKSLLLLASIYHHADDLENARSLYHKAIAILLENNAAPGEGGGLTRLNFTETMQNLSRSTSVLFYFYPLLTFAVLVFFPSFFDS